MVDVLPNSLILQPGMPVKWRQNLPQVLTFEIAHELAHQTEYRFRPGTSHFHVLLALSLTYIKAKTHARYRISEDITVKFYAEKRRKIPSQS